MDNHYCEVCGSMKVRYLPAEPARPDEPAHGEALECQRCGHIQAYQRDYEYYPEDFID